MRNHGKYKSTLLQCPECRNITSIYRAKGNLKKAGHLKKLYCWKCKEYINHVELVDEGYEVADFNNLTPVNLKKDRVLCVKKVQTSENLSD